MSCEDDELVACRLCLTTSYLEDELDEQGICPECLGPYTAFMKYGQKVRREADELEWQLNWRLWKERAPELFGVKSQSDEQPDFVCAECGLDDLNNPEVSADDVDPSVCTDCAANSTELDDGYADCEDY